MANLGQQFDASQVAPSTGYDVIPKGEYVMRITDSDVVSNSAQTGNVLKLTLEVVSGEYAGRKVFDQLNLSNPNEMAVKISRERLSAYCHATGVIQLQDSQQLHGIPFVAKVKIKVDKNGVYDDRNEIASCKKMEQGGGAPQGFSGQPQGQPQGFGGAPAGFGGQPAQGGFAPQQQPAQQQVQAQGGYAQFAGQPQDQGFQAQQVNTQAGFPQGNPQGQVQPQSQGAPMGNPQGQQAVDTAPVPDMAFGGQQQGQAMAQGGFQTQQPVDQGQQQQQAAGGAKAPWEM